MFIMCLLLFYGAQICHNVHGLYRRVDDMGTSFMLLGWYVNDWINFRLESACLAIPGNIKLTKFSLYFQYFALHLSVIFPFSVPFVTQLMH